jgi:Putative metallopeptidase
MIGLHINPSEFGFADLKHHSFVESKEETMRKLHTNVLNIITNSMISVAAVTISVIVVPGAQAESPDGQIRVEYEPAQTSLYQAVSGVLQRDQSFEVAAESSSEVFVLSRDITVSFQECGTDVTHYDASMSQIVMCYELLESFRQDFEASEVVTAEEAPYFAMSAGLFVFLHELGHALIHDWNLPVLGREEDAADQFATVFLSFGGRDSLRLAWAAALQLWLTSQQEPNQYWAWDEHSSPLQRFYSIACLSYGSNPAEYPDLPEAILPTSQRAQCVEQSQQTIQSWAQLLQPHIRTESE